MHSSKMKQFVLFFCINYLDASNDMLSTRDNLELIKFVQLLITNCTFQKLPISAVINTHFKEYDLW